ncbi:aminotransferase class I/II-fold pyridoxal phosphate-dependent enzyme, partial [Arthrospira platensis SPKY1]|nr:aminotransferase class I/II-fold pyridoxal phosphate-dependent enzyme [Arthrospira platensis SPKY1]
MTAETDILVLSDEVYEHLVYDGQSHQSVLRYPRLRERSLAVYSFGKTFHNTGWKVGYCIAPPMLTKELRKVHQYNTFSVHTPTQYALADYLADAHTYLSLPDF